jgi:hypothetical protein
MATLEDRQQNLFNATETLAQFYDEIETFLDILYSHMEREGYAAKGERLRSGTATPHNLTRRLLATATVFYIKGISEVDDDDEDDTEEEDGGSTSTLAKTEISIGSDLRLPFVRVALFEPNTIPSVRTLTAPMLSIGCVGEMCFIDKRTGEPVQPDVPALAVSNLANIRLPRIGKQGDAVYTNCWRPSRMKKYKLMGKLVDCQSQPLLEIDSQEKVKGLAQRLVSFCG